MNMEELFFFTDTFDDFFQFWKGLEKDAACLIPRKTSLDPRDLIGLLQRVALFEVKGPTNVIARLTGTGLDAILGRNITGKNMFDFYNEQDGKTYKNLHEQVLGGPFGAMSIREFETPDGNRQMVRAIGLPLSDQAGTPRFIFSVYEFDQSPKKNLLNEYVPFEKFDNFDYKLFDLNSGKFVS